MALDLSSFGKVVASSRKIEGLSQKELAAKILKEDGEAITPQYLNDIEHDRRRPSSDHLIKQFSKVLKIELTALYAVVGMLPEQDRKLVKLSTQQQLTDAFVAFRQNLSNGRK
jgi:ribosome-binding protein aMBF1 (putative translation factor)